MTARRHHFISQCYLKAFAILRKAGKYQVHVFDRDTRKTFQTSTENIALERDFNRVDVEGHPPDAFEKGFAAFEGELAPALERTIEAVAFQSDEDKNLIFNLIGYLALRNPRWRESIRQFHEETSKKIMDLTLATKERWEGQMRRAQESGDVAKDPKVTYEEMKKFHEDGEYTITLETSYHLQTEMKMLDTLLPILARRKWLFLKASKDSGGFATSDHPCCLMWSDEAPRPPFDSPGFGLPGTEVLVPLSSKVALLGAFELDDGVRDLDEELVAAVNGRIAFFATRQVYARDLHFRYQFPGDEVRKASRLVDDARFIRRLDNEDGTQQKEVPGGATTSNSEQ